MNDLYFIFILFRSLLFLIQQTDPNRLLQISFFFHRKLVYVYLEKASCAVCGETCAILVTVFAPLILLRKFALILPGKK